MPGEFGDWRIEGQFDDGVTVEIRDEHDGLICELEPLTGEWTESEIARARLIAAAPEVLACLREMRTACSVCFNVIASAGLADELERGFIASGLKEGFGVRSEDAITKAEGKSDGR